MDNAFDGNPLLSDSPRVWNDLIESADPASLLLVIESRMGGALRRSHAPDDVLQDVLLAAWRQRERFEWRGRRAFRSWLLTIIDNRIRDLAEQENAQKRGGGAVLAMCELTGPAGGSCGGETPPEPIASTTPSRIAMARERATAMQAALDSLPADQAEVVRLRLFDQLSVEGIAARLRIGVAAVQHRLRKGAQEYRRRLLAELTSRSAQFAARNAPESTADSVSEL